MKQQNNIAKQTNTIVEVMTMAKKNKYKRQAQYNSDVSGSDLYQIRQNSQYDLETGKAEPDNNIFWQERSNPLSSKGN
ncbi:hypothetical protein [Clostridium sp. MD294]|uniref:hypothetical protein n=1 Tax=Clostridium sp. MD294 TaxID=97138 RepID=UPI0012E9CBB6|nr:hypothetical protein [Clostridium sp. MD294]NDO46965.1 hypothetical protein [Clostridium sp. MD294]